VLGKRDLHHETRGIDLLLYLSPFLGEFVRAKRKPNFGNAIGRKSWISSYSFTCPRWRASREQIRPVENVILVIVILLPVKYLLKLSGPVIFTDYV
jgi:hypothetical protein